MEDCSTDKQLRQETLSPTVDRRVRRTSRDVDKERIVVVWLRCPLWPVHTGDYSRRIRRLSPKTATVAEFGDNLSPKSATMVSSVDRAL